MEIATKGGNVLRLIVFYVPFSVHYRFTCRKNTKNLKNFKKYKVLIRHTGHILDISDIFCTFAAENDVGGSLRRCLTI